MGWPLLGGADGGCWKRARKWLLSPHTSWPVRRWACILATTHKVQRCCGIDEHSKARSLLQQVPKLALTVNFPNRRPEGDKKEVVKQKRRLGLKCILGKVRTAWILGLCWVLLNSTLHVVQGAMPKRTVNSWFVYCIIGKHGALIKPEWVSNPSVTSSSKEKTPVHCHFISCLWFTWF